MHIVLVFALALVMQTGAAVGGEHMIVKESPYPVAKTLDRLTAILKKKGITIFARVDHAAGAKKAGLSLKATELLIFGNPKLGTPLMAAERRIGLDLPVKALAWEDDSGKVWLGYTKPDALKARYGVKGVDGVFGKMTGALDKLTGAAVKAE